jgi:hypothetical protein
MIVMKYAYTQTFAKGHPLNRPFVNVAVMKCNNIATAEVWQNCQQLHG